MMVGKYKFIIKDMALERFQYKEKVTATKMNTLVDGINSRTGFVHNVVASGENTAVVAYSAEHNASTYRVTTASGNTALKGIIGLSVKCPEFAKAEGTVEKVMAVEFLTATADFSLALTTSGDAVVEEIPWVDGVEPVWQSGKVYTLCVSSLGVSVSYRGTSNLYGE